MHWYSALEVEAWKSFALEVVGGVALAVYVVSSAILGLYASWYIASFIEFLRAGSPTHSGLLDRVERPAWPRVGVVIPVYNDYEVLAAVKALQTLSYPNIVAVIVDDSDDRELSLALSNAALRSRIRLLHMKRPSRRGLKAGALNEAIDYLTNVEDVSYVLILDSDFEVEPGMVEMLVSLALEYDADIVQGYQRHGKGSDSPLGLIYRASMAGSIINLVGRYRMGLFPIFTGSCGLISRRLLDSVRFREWSLSEDWRLTIDSFLANPDTGVVVTHEAAATGAVPKSQRALWRQQLRWSAGTLSELLDTFWDFILTREIPVSAKLGYLLQGLFFTNGFWVYANMASSIIASRILHINLGVLWPLGVYLWLLGIETIVAAGAVLEGYSYKQLALTAIYLIGMIYYLALMHLLGTLKYLISGSAEWVVTSKRGVYRDYYKD